MPSTHALGGLLPFTIILALGRRGEAISWHWWIGATAYLVCVSLSRLYLGVHSVLDIASSIVLGTPVILMFHFSGEAFEQVVFFHPYSIALHIVMTILFVVAVPRAAPWTASYGTSTQIFGLFIGLASSMWYTRNHAFDLWQSLEYTSWNRWNKDNFNEMAAKVMLGFVVVIAAKVVFKVVSLEILKFLYRQGHIVEHEKFKKDVAGSPVPMEKLYCIECTARYSQCDLSRVYLLTLL